MDSRLTNPQVDLRSFRAGGVIGVLAFIILLGAMKDAAALLTPGGRGALTWGYLMVRYSSLQRVWFGYRFSQDLAWYMTIPHAVLYAVAAYGLWMLRRWAWYLVFGYLFYVPISSTIFMVLYPFGYLTGVPYEGRFFADETIFYVGSLFFVAGAIWMLFRYREFFH